MPVLVISGVSTVVKRAAAALVRPMVLLLMVTPLTVPPPMATSLVWNWPPPVMMARTRPPVTKRKSTGVAVSSVPMKLLFASGAKPKAPPLLVPMLPVSVQPELEVSGSIQRSAP